MCIHVPDATLLRSAGNGGMTQVTDTLFANTGFGSSAIALPCFRIGLVLDGMLDVPANRAAVVAMTDAFLKRYGADLRFCATLKDANSKGRAIKATPKKISEIVAAVSKGLESLYEIRLYGSDDNPLEVPFLPYLTVSHAAYPMTLIEIMVPHDPADPTSFPDQIDAIARTAPVRLGFQGLGFGKTTLRFYNEFLLPPAFQRFRTAIMGRFDSAPTHLWFRRDNFVKTKGDYAPGITQTGWRTYVGAAFRDRLGDPAATNAAGVTVEHLPQMTVVTAGPEPIWGDVNAGESISIYQAAHQYVRLAYAERKWLISFAPWSNSDPESTELSEGYLDRFLPKAAA